MEDRRQFNRVITISRWEPTFKGDNDDLLPVVLGPFADLAERMNEDTGIDDESVRDLIQLGGSDLGSDKPAGVAVKPLSLLLISRELNATTSTSATTPTAAASTPLGPNVPVPIPIPAASSSAVVDDPVAVEDLFLELGNLMCEKRSA